MNKKYYSTDPEKQNMYEIICMYRRGVKICLGLAIYVLITFIIFFYK